LVVWLVHAASAAQSPRWLVRHAASARYAVHSSARAFLPALKFGRSSAAPVQSMSSWCVSSCTRAQVVAIVRAEALVSAAEKLLGHTQVCLTLLQQMTPP